MYLFKLFGIAQAEWSTTARSREFAAVACGANPSLAHLRSAQPRPRKSVNGSVGMLIQGGEVIRVEASALAGQGGRGDLLTAASVRTLQYSGTDGGGRAPPRPLPHLKFYFKLWESPSAGRHPPGGPE